MPYNKIVLKLYDNKKLVFSISREEIEFYLLCWEINYTIATQRRKYPFIPPQFFICRSFKDGIWFFECEDGFWFIKNDEVVIVAYDDLITLLNENKTLQIEWDEALKHKIWWLDYSPIEYQFGYTRAINFKEIEAQIVEVFKKFKKHKDLKRKKKQK